MTDVQDTTYSFFSLDFIKFLFKKNNDMRMNWRAHRSS